MPVLVGLAGIALIAVTIFFLYQALHRTFAALIRPLVWFTSAEISGAKKNASWVLKKVKAVFSVGGVLPALVKGIEHLALPLVHAAEFVEHWIHGVISHALSATLHPMKLFFDALSSIAQHVPASIQLLADSTHKAFVALTQHWIPAKIEDAIAPVRKLATTTYTEVKAGTSSIALTLTGLGWTTADDISTSLGNFGHAFANLWHYTRGQLTDAVASLSSLVGTLTDITIPGMKSDILSLNNDVRIIGDTLIPKIEGEIDAVTDSISGLASQIGELAGEIPLEGAFAAAAVAAVELAVPELFCNGTRSAARKLCGLDTALLDSLLALSLAWLVVIDPEEIARLALGAEEIMEPIIERVAA